MQQIKQYYSFTIFESLIFIHFKNTKNKMKYRNRILKRPDTALELPDFLQSG